MSLSNRKEWLLVDPDISLKLPFHLLEADFLLAPNGFDNLERLLLEGNKFVSLLSFERFYQPHKLLLDNCESLRKIPELQGNLLLLGASDCKSLLDTNDNLMDKIIWNSTPKSKLYVQDVIFRTGLPNMRRGFYRLGFGFKRTEENRSE